MKRGPFETYASVGRGKPLQERGLAAPRLYEHVGKDRKDALADEFDGGLIGARVEVDRRVRDGFLSTRFDGRRANTLVDVEEVQDGAISSLTLAKRRFGSAWRLQLGQRSRRGPFGRVGLDEAAWTLRGGQGDVRELELGLGGGRGRTPRQIAPASRFAGADDVHGYQPLGAADVVLLPEHCFSVSPGPSKDTRRRTGLPNLIRGGEAVVAVARREMLGTVLGGVARVGASGGRYRVLALGFRMSDSRSVPAAHASTARTSGPESCRRGGSRC